MNEPSLVLLVGFSDIKRDDLTVIQVTPEDLSDYVNRPEVGAIIFHANHKEQVIALKGEVGRADYYLVDPDDNFITLTEVINKLKVKRVTTELNEKLWSHVYDNLIILRNVCEEEWVIKNA